MEIFINKPDTLEALLSCPMKYFKAYSLPGDFLNEKGKEIQSIFVNVSFEKVDGFTLHVTSVFKICPEKSVFPDHILYKLSSVDIRKPLISDVDIMMSWLTCPPPESIHKLTF